jgi:hypothetical protein
VVKHTMPWYFANTSGGCSLMGCGAGARLVQLAILQCGLLSRDCSGWGWQG